MTTPCVFCELPAERVVLDGRLAVAIRDSFPVSPGHTLVIPRRHVASFFETTGQEREELMELLFTTRDALDREFRPSGYNMN